MALKKQNQAFSKQQPENDGSSFRQGDLSKDGNEEGIKIRDDKYMAGATSMIRQGSIF